MRFGLIGTNFVTDFLLDAARDVPEFELGAIYSRTPERAAAFAEKYRAQYGQPRLYSSLDDLADDRSIDAVYIASPNALHCEQAIKMLRAKKHVLCEKPMASNSRELARMLDCARENGRVLLEAMRIQFTPQTAALQALCERLGPVRRARISFCQYSSRYDRFLAGERLNTFDPALSNAAIMDLGVYCLSLMVRLFGEPQSITASSLFLENGFEAAGTVTARYGQMLCDAVYSKITADSAPCEIQGERANLLFDRVTMLGSAELIDRATGAREKIELEGPRHDMSCELRAFCAMARGEQSPQRWQEMTRTVTGLLDAARAQTGVRFPADREGAE